MTDTTSPYDLLDTHDQIRALLLDAADHGLPAPHHVSTRDLNGHAEIIWYCLSTQDPADARTVLDWMREQDSDELTVVRPTVGYLGTTVTIETGHSDGIRLALATYAAHVCVETSVTTTETVTRTVWQLADDTADIDGWPELDPVEMGADR